MAVHLGTPDISPVLTYPYLQYLAQKHSFNPIGIRGVSGEERGMVCEILEIFPKHLCSSCIHLTYAGSQIL